MDGRSQAFNARRNRNSILQTAGDALGIRMNKKKRMSIRQPPALVDDVVLEISAAKNNINYDYTAVQESVDDSTERERLRDAAAQAVGLPQPQVVEDHSTSLNAHGVEEQVARLPTFPATLSDLQTLIHTSATASKYCPVSSPLLRLSRSKQWKTRHIALTTVRPRRELGGSQSHIHLFKTSAPHDREIERMSITQDSVVYIADEEFLGGRKFVIKVGGTTAHASNLKRDENSAGSTWLLQMPDASQMQRWIDFIKGAVLMQRAEQAGVGPVLYQNTYNNVGPELKGDVDVILSMGKQGLFTAPSTIPTGNSFETTAASNPAEEFTTSVLQRHDSANAKAVFNGRPPSRHMSISGSSIATALASPTHHPSQGSLQNTIHEAESSTQEGSSGKVTRDSTLFNIFRPTSPIQPAPLKSTLSPPLSPTLQHTPMDENVLSSPSTLTSRFSGPISPRHGHHSSSLSADWDFVDGGSFPSVTTKRIMQVTQTALAPPPRKRPLTNGGLPNRQGTPPKDQSEPKRLSTPPAVVTRRSLDDEGEHSFGDVIGQSSFTESSATGQDGQEDTGPELSNTTPISETDRDEASFAQPIPSPMAQHTPPLLPSCSSSFGVNTSAKTATLEHLASNASRPSTPSLHSEQHEHYTEEDVRPMEGDAEYISHFHLPTGSSRRSRMSGIPKQSPPPLGPPPLGPPPAIPIFQSPPFPAQSPSHDYSSSERPGSSSSIPSTVPSLHMGLSLTSKRMSIMTTSDAPSFQSTESSGGASQSNKNPNGSIGSNRLSTSGQGSRGYAYPPPRPAPSQALPLPPAPLDDINSIGGKHRHSLSGRVRSTSPNSTSGPSARSEFISRMVRHSVGPAAPPPTTALPPRPEMDDDFGYHPSSDVSQSPSNGVKPLFSIPGSPRRISTTLPAMQPPPLRPLPPTPNKVDDHRPVSPSRSVNSDRSTRSTPVAFSSNRMSSIKARFRMKSQPTQPSGSTLDYQRLPPAPPPPSVPPPAAPGEIEGTKHQHIRASTDSQAYSRMSGESAIHRRESSIANYSGGLPSPTSPTMQAYTPLTGMRSSIPQPAAMPLSPPPRRNSRASRDLTPQEKEKWKAVVESLDEDKPVVPYQSNAPVRHSALNLPDANAFI